MSGVERASPEVAPCVVGIGGTARSGSTTERALVLALQHAERRGARTRLFGGAQLGLLPHFDPASEGRTAKQAEFTEAVRGADGVILASPGYHGGVSGLVKNALDLLEDLRDAEAPYLSGRAIGCIVTGYGWQTCGTTLGAMRSIVHALRGWPTPIGAALNVSEGLFEAKGDCTDPKASAQLNLVAEQVVEFALSQRSRTRIAPAANGSQGKS